MEISKDNQYVSITDRSLILKLRSLGAGVEEENSVNVSILEAAYFADRKVLPISKDDLLKAALINDKMALEKYHTIKYLRDLGYIVRPSLDSSPFLRLHRKGFRPGEDKTQYLIYVLKSEQAIDFKQISEYLDSSGKLRKELVIAFVDLSREKPYLVKLGRMNIE